MIILVSFESDSTREPNRQHQRQAKRKTTYYARMCAVNEYMNDVRLLMPKLLWLQLHDSNLFVLVVRLVGTVVETILLSVVAVKNDATRWWWSVSRAKKRKNNSSNDKCVWRVGGWKQGNLDSNQTHINIDQHQTQDCCPHFCLVNCERTSSSASPLPRTAS